MADALATLARLRRMEADQARRALGMAIGQERQAVQAAANARADRQREALLAARAADPLAGAYAAWLPASVRTIAQADAAVSRSAADRDLAAASLAGCKAALEAVETLIDERNHTRRRHASRRAQSRLDEMGHRLGPATRQVRPAGG